MLGVFLVDPPPSPMYVGAPAMSSLPKCPVCDDGERFRFLPALSARSRVDYYRCYCSHVWSVDKETRELIEQVTHVHTRCAPPLN